MAFQSDREGDLAIVRQRADGSGTAERLTKPEAGTLHIPQSWSPDGAHLLFTVQKGQESSLWVLSLKEQRQSPFGDVKSPNLTEGAFSPDGRWIAYQGAGSTTTRQVFVQPFPATGAKYLVRQGGHPYWTPKADGLILNVGPGQSVLIPVTTTPRVAFGQPLNVDRRGRGEGNPGITRRNVDSMPDGEHIIGVPTEITAGGGLTAEIIVVLNWFDDVKRRAPRP